MYDGKGAWKEMCRLISEEHPANCSLRVEAKLVMLQVEIQRIKLIEKGELAW